MTGRLPRIVLAAFLAAFPASGAPAGYFDFGPNVTFETGDTWISAGRRYRIYGLQSCLRQTFYTDRSGNKRDCGEASIAVLGAYVRDTHPLCAPVATQADLTFVTCYATVGGERLDLAMMMITEGFGFASLSSDGLPVYPTYAVAEQKAREARRGLWQFDDVQHPSILLSHAAKNARMQK
ncbi:Succinoglycan biosynthesis protein ExoI-like protein (plasmid) [Neorhizobium galegae bv. officinalis bv. officinalis str. HAMBI 1141]|uniref:Succinoglycan biosynthesis protein ExoI-like protein n=1 Tax=Neorhizobium galegae bv. officinalis bv. officinalis str. HAMBI 1141 TaxID=1028801 RepID=A0A068THY2_NEOGA|nr:succinoglycan biosynthesis protein exoi [Neorhizobium galegae]CDN57681.1 Succinoglycan biosynthesis protein ExoI-like protein [Neorhizobium galegae bv. officinalis bv. officinalis str. HAMBI 1141]